MNPADRHSTTERTIVQRRRQATWSGALAADGPAGADEGPITPSGDDGRRCGRLFETIISPCAIKRRVGTDRRADRWRSAHWDYSAITASGQIENCGILRTLPFDAPVLARQIR